MRSEGRYILRCRNGVDTCTGLRIAGQGVQMSCLTQVEDVHISGPCCVEGSIHLLPSIMTTSM